jgi:hypothetical protein
MMHFFLEFELKQKKQIRKGKEKKEEGHTCCRPFFPAGRSMQLMGATHQPLHGHDQAMVSLTAGLTPWQLVRSCCDCVL